MKKGNRAEEKLEKLLANFTESLTIGAKPGEIDPLSEKKDEVLSLLGTIRIVSTAMRPKQPSEAFVARVSYAVQERFQEQVSTEKLQRIIGMAVTIETFRKSLFQDIVAACYSVGLTLTPREVAALRNLKEDAVEEFANSLDERITKFFPTNLP